MNIKVNLNKNIDKSYVIKISDNLIELKKFIERSDLRPIIITDSFVENLFSLSYEKIVILPGEKSKNLKTIEKIEDQMMKMQYGKDSIIIAIGGGVIGDISGFVASTYFRGINYVHVPTTLLAMVDSSIGGKTGVNTKYGKNLIGTIWQPKAVFQNIEFLKTLPEKELISGMAEIIKHSIVEDKDLFNFLKTNRIKIIDKNKEILHELIEWNSKIKARIIEKDEKELGLRKILNFGHTIGHAIEKLSGFKIRHGEAVSIGMTVESKISQKLGFLSSKEIDSIASLQQSYRLPTKIPKIYTKKKLVDETYHDKKVRQGIPEYVIIRSIGKVKLYSKQVDERIIGAAIDESY